MSWTFLTNNNDKREAISISLLKLRELQSLAQESANCDYESAEYRVTAIILDTAQYWLFRPVRSDLLSTDANTFYQTCFYQQEY